MKTKKQTIVYFHFEINDKKNFFAYTERNSDIKIAFILTKSFVRINKNRNQK